MKLRMFVTLHVLQDTNSNRYRKEQVELDFPTDVNVEAAQEEIYHLHGKLGRDDRNNQLAPMKYAVIHGHQLVNEHHREPDKISRHQEQDLLDPITLKACLKDSPKEAAKRKHRDRGMTE